MKPRASARTGRRAASATDDEVRAQAVLRLVEDLLEPQAVHAIGELALDDLVLRCAQKPYAQRVEHGDQPRIGVRVVREDDTHCPAFSGGLIVENDLTIHCDDSVWHLVGPDHRGGFEQLAERRVRLKQGQIGEIGCRNGQAMPVQLVCHRTYGTAASFAPGSTLIVRFAR